MRAEKLKEATHSSFEKSFHHKIEKLHLFKEEKERELSCDQASREVQGQKQGR